MSHPNETRKMPDGTNYLMIPGELIAVALRLANLRKDEFTDAELSFAVSDPGLWKATFTGPTPKKVVFLAESKIGTLGSTAYQYACSSILQATPNYPVISTRGNHIYNDLGDALKNAFVTSGGISFTDAQRSEFLFVLDSYRIKRDGVNGIRGFDQKAVEQNRDDFGVITNALNNELKTYKQRATDVSSLLNEKKEAYYKDTTARGTVYAALDSGEKARFTAWENDMNGLITKMASILSSVGG